MSCVVLTFDTGGMFVVMGGMTFLTLLMMFFATRRH